MMMQRHPDSAGTGERGMTTPAATIPTTDPDGKSATLAVRWVFPEHDRPRRRVEWRQRWGLAADETVALFAAMNYRLKGLEPLLHAAGDPLDPLAVLVERPVDGVGRMGDRGFEVHGGTCYTD